jgi:hypothetical protein
MFDIVDSKTVRREYEEKIRSLSQAKDYDRWLIDRAGSWLAQQTGSLLSSLGNSIAVLVKKLTAREDKAGQLESFTPDPERTPAGR